jgi:endo-1,4-beta-D-glucanase Y
MRGPTPATSTTAFPFPQNRQAAGCVYPAAYQNSDVQTAYAKWKADLVTSNNAGGHQRVQRTSTDGIDTCRPLNSTVSEGIGYGMLIAVYMGDQGLFDDFWLYEQGQLDPNGLMNWAPNGTDPNMCNGGASDADEDMAFALIMADKQWGGQGSLSQSYAQSAITQIQKIWQNEIFNYTYVRAGDGTWATNTNQNISYYAPAYYRAFAAIDPKTCPKGMGHSNSCDGWWDVIDQSYSTIGDALNAANGNQANGLVPGWCDDSQGAPCHSSSGQPFNYQYDACRTPFRVGIDSCWNAYPAAQSYVAKTTSFFAPIGASQMADGYALNGTPQPANQGKLSAAFIGPATVGAMSSSADQSFVNDGYAVIAADNAFAGGEYYESSWTVMSLLMLTGNFLDYTQETPAH